MRTFWEHWRTSISELLSGTQNIQKFLGAETAFPGNDIAWFLIFFYGANYAVLNLILLRSSYRIGESYWISLIYTFKTSEMKIYDPPRVWTVHIHRRFVVIKVLISGKLDISLHVNLSYSFTNMSVPSFLPCCIYHKLSLCCDSVNIDAFRCRLHLDCRYLDVYVLTF